MMDGGFRGGKRILAVLDRPRPPHTLTVRGIVSTARAIDRVSRGANPGVRATILSSSHLRPSGHENRHHLRRGNRLRRRRVEFLDFMSTRTCISTSRRRGPLGSIGGDLVLDPARKVLHGGSITSVKQDIDAFIEAYNQNPKPFVWAKAKFTSVASKSTSRLIQSDCRV
jgi:hypothetical protein